MEEWLIKYPSTSLLYTHCPHWNANVAEHDGVKFPISKRPIVRRIYQPPVNFPHKRAGNAELWCFRNCRFEQAVEQVGQIVDVCVCVYECVIEVVNNVVARILLILKNSKCKARLFIFRENSINWTVFHHIMSKITVHMLIYSNAPGKYTHG